MAKVIGKSFPTIRKSFSIIRGGGLSLQASYRRIDSVEIFFIFHGKKIYADKHRLTFNILSTGHDFLTS